VKNTDDDMQLLKICVAFPLFHTGIEGQSHFTVWVSMFSWNMRHAYYNYFKGATMTPFQPPDLIL